jgi:hypothetical protein
MLAQGIAFDAHEIIGTQREIGFLFGYEDHPWRLDTVEKHSERFYVALTAVMYYAQSLDLEDYAHQFTDEFMSEHSEYHCEQTEEWWSNPAFRCAGLGSSEEDPSSEYHGTYHARWLVEQTVPELRAALAEVLHISPAEVKAALENPSYTGPLQILADDTLWEQLVTFSKQDLPLDRCKGVDELRALIHEHYKPLYLTNVWMEELVKEFKNLTAQARAHPATAEVRIMLKQRTDPDPMDKPSREQIKECRRELGHHLPSRLRPKRTAPEPLEEIVWEGEPPADEDGEDEEEDLEGLAIPVLKSRLRKRGVTGALPRSHKRLVERLQESLEHDEDDGEEEEPAHEEEEEDEGEPDEEADPEEEAMLQKLRDGAPRVDRAALVEGRAFFCWDNAKLAGCTPCLQLEPPASALAGEGELSV